MPVAALSCLTTAVAMSQSGPDVSRAAAPAAEPKPAITASRHIAPRRPTVRPKPRKADPVAHALRIAAATYGVPEDKLRRVARCESTLNPKARNGQYVGLFQFGSYLWGKTPYARFSRTDPHAAALAAAWAFKRGMARNWPVCGRR